ncbi:MAG: transcription antitermination factor NusB [bacterium]|nr:transcription antitermination factor NusB [bacterium]
MGSRRKGRELVLTLLYRTEFSSDKNIKRAIENIIKLDTEQYGSDTRDFAEDLFRGVLANREIIDKLLEKYLEHWEINRVAVIDKSIMKMAIHEILFRNDIPDVVSINEAVELAKKYSTEKSGGFVNGILDRIRKDKRGILKSINE